MYRIFIALSLGLLISGVSHADNIFQTPVKISKAFIPMGFDDNDQSQLVVAGILPDSCYQLGPSQIDVDKNTKTIYLSQNAYVHEGPCRDVIIPYTQIYDVGILDQGNYKVVDKNKSTNLGTLTVTKALKATADDFLYLPTTDAFVKKEDTTKKREVVLEGKFTNRCTHYKETIVHYYPDVIVVQPIVTHESGERCGIQYRRFQVKVPLKDGMTGAKLLHVRSMDGKAINKIVDLD